jgi:hypothetical protein
MKPERLILILVAVCVITAPVLSFAQQMELTPYVGYRWTSQIKGGTYTTPDDRVLTNHDFKSAPNFGLTFDIRLMERLMLEFMGEAMPTTFRAEDDATPKNTGEFDVNLYYIHIGLLYEILEQGISGEDVKVRPFIMGSLGSTIADGEGDIESEMLFSAAFALGFKSMFNNWFGLRFQGRYMYTYLAAANDYWCTGDGTGLGENCTVYPSSTSLSQIDVTLGAIFSF